MARQSASPKRKTPKRVGLSLDVLIMAVAAVALVAMGLAGIGPKWEITRRVSVPVITADSANLTVEKIQQYLIEAESDNRD